MKKFLFICLPLCTTLLICACESLSDESVSTEITTTADLPISRDVANTSETNTDSSVSNTVVATSETYGVSTAQITETIKEENDIVSSELQADEITTYNDTDVVLDIQEETKMWDNSWDYADYSEIHEDSVKLYRTQNPNRKNFIVAVNAGHGTVGGWNYQTYCHPDKTAKYVTGSTAAGAIKSASVSSGMAFPDGTPEGEINLDVALVVKDRLLAEGYDVLMMREDNNCQLDNVARAVFANQYADCHISLHFDASDYDKGAFFIGVPDVQAYKSMEPVASHWKEHSLLGECLINGLIDEEIKIYNNGRADIDLTQTSFSTIPSVCVELGDKGTNVTDDFKSKVADAITNGVNRFMESIDNPQYE